MGSRIGLIGATAGVALATTAAWISYRRLCIVKDEVEARAEEHCRRYQNAKYAQRRAQQDCEAALKKLGQLEHERALLASRCDDLEAALAHALRREQSRDAEAQQMAEQVAEERAALEEARKAIEMEGARQASELEKRRQALEAARTMREQDTAQQRIDAEARLESLQGELAELRSANSETTSAIAARTALASPPSGEPQRETREARRAQLQQDSARRRAKVAERRALAASLEAQLGMSPQDQKAAGQGRAATLAAPTGLPDGHNIKT